MDVEIMVSAVEDMGLPDSSKRAGLCVTELAAADMQVTVAGGVPTDVVSMGPCDWVLDWAALVNDAHTPDHGESMTRTRQTTVRGGGGGQQHPACTSAFTISLACLMEASTASSATTVLVCSCLQEGRWCGASATAGQKPPRPP